MTRQWLWAPQAWIGGEWAADVLLEVDATGRWSQVAPATQPPPDAMRLPGPALPGLVDAHSHAFQRAFAGLAERRHSAHDDFWAWRDRMYGVALRITPAQLRAVAAQLYTELLAGGYTQVCEFHYLQHAADGAPHGDPLAMSRPLVEAADEVGIGLTLLPVLYERAGFAQPRLRAEQRRFGADADAAIALRDGIRALQVPRVNAGVAIHSLRAATPASMRRLLQLVGDDPAPVHIHIAEQRAEVADCLAATGARPIEWLLREMPVDARWQLVHATHATAAEIEAVAACGAGVVLCPSTEANLGDGLADLPRWLAAGSGLSLGSDSNVCRQWPEELRWLEYGQRLRLGQRNVAALPALGQGATAANLFQRVLEGGAAAGGLGRPQSAAQPKGAARAAAAAPASASPATGVGLAVGARADLLVLDTLADGMLGVPPSHWLDALVFASSARAWLEVWVAGAPVVRQGRHPRSAATATAFEAAMQALWPAV